MPYFWQKMFCKKKAVDQPELEKWAHRLPKTAFIIWAAGHVANQLTENKLKHITLTQMLDGVDDGSTGMFQHCVERFIMKYYFSDYFDPHKEKTIMVFRKIVKRKILKHFQPN